MRSKLKEYYHALDGISLANSDLDKKRDILKDIINLYHSNTQKISVDKNLLKQNKEMTSHITSTVKSLKSATANWIVNFKEVLEKEKFRSDLENYFIVIIFGKVKAGKSSLGNFIAQNRLESQKINFFKYDEAGKEQNIKKLEEIEDNNHGFATANLECTVEIQGFKLSGMAWVDTPGLGSMVEENGELAKDYIQSADYIIYPTNSSSPLQQDEKDQIKELFEQNKKVTICITKSDDIEEDEVDGKLVKVLVNKSDLNRQSQEKWVKTEIDDILKNNDSSSKLGDIISISVHTAKYGLKHDDNEMFEKSNLVEFYELMTDVVKNKAKTLKENTPYDSLVSFIDNDILGVKSKNTTSIKSLQVNISKFEQEIQESKERFKQLKTNLDTDITVHIDSIVSKHIGNLKSNSSKNDSWGMMFGGSSLNNGKNNSIFKTIDYELSQTISTMINENIQEMLNSFSVTLNNLTTSLESTDSFRVEDKYKTIKVRYIDNSWYNPGGIWGDEYSSEEERVHIGDNKQEMIANFKSNRLSSYLKVAKENYEAVDKQFFTPLLKISKNMDTNIQNLNDSIVQFKNNLK